MDLARPGNHALQLIEDGSLMIGGSVSDFKAAKRSMVKLNQGTVSTRDQDRLEDSEGLPQSCFFCINVQFALRFRVDYAHRRRSMTESKRCASLIFREVRWCLILCREPMVVLTFRCWLRNFTCCRWWEVMEASMWPKES